LLARLLPPYARGSSDTMFGFEVYGDVSDKLWFKLTLGAYHRHVLANVDRVYYWIKDRTFTRHHIVNTGVKPGWKDVDELMFRACFALLRRFVENELRYARVDDDDQYRGYRLHCEGGTDEAAIDLYHWYRYALTALEQEEEANWQTFHDKHGWGYVEGIKNEKLNELMKMRCTLWT